MKGILLISHGPLAEGYIKTLEMFFGEGIPQLDSHILRKDDAAEDFREQLLKKVDSLDSGDGVLVFADLLGGTPCNQSIFIENPNVTVVAGMNLPMLMECLGMRLGGTIDIDALIKTGQDGMVNFSQIVENKKNKKRKRKETDE